MALHIIMGPAGCGKTSVARALSEASGWTMIEADDHHSASNIQKQSDGIALTDADRAVWIDSMVSAINASPEDNLILACSALTPYVQSRLRSEVKRDCFWYLLDVPKEVLAERLASRESHFFPADLLQSQLDALKPPETAIRIDANRPVEMISETILNLATRSG